MNEYSMPGYFRNMPMIGEDLYMPDPDNEEQLKKIEAEITGLKNKALDAGRSDESLNESGQLTPM